MVMENGSPTIGFEDGTIDVDCLLVEPQNGHVSMDSAMCFNEKIPDNSIDMEDVSCSFGLTNTGIAQGGDEILDRDVLDSICSEVEDGYFRLQNDFCSMGEEYLLGFEFPESITNLDYISREEALQTSVSYGPPLGSCLNIDSTPWKSNLFSIMEPTICHNMPETLVEEEKKPLNEDIIDKFHDISSCSFGDVVLSDEKYTSPSPSNDEFGQVGPTKFNKLDNTLLKMSAETLPTQKRSRKPTQRYIDELADPISRHSKKRREFSSSSTVKDKTLVVKDHKKCQMGSRAMILPSEEESSIIAIQVPFGSLAHKECPNLPSCDAVHGSDRGNPTIKPKENQKKRDDCMTALDLKKRDESAATSACPKKREDDVIAAHLRKGDRQMTAVNLKKRDESAATSASPKKREGDAIAAHLRKGERRTIPSQKKRDEYDPSFDCPEEEVSGRRKHHILWTTAEVRKLIDGVSEHGVGRWSRIKKLLFSSSAHRTSVDLKDKWRNLLKASGSQGQGSLQVGERRRNLAWRPLPKSILRRVRELANVYPYPKGRKHKIGARINRDSPDISTDITLSDYRRILRSINGD
ncbi:hypothetical protein ABFS82_10G094900 [Erythranthe guttata]